MVVFLWVSSLQYSIYKPAVESQAKPMLIEENSMFWGWLLKKSFPNIHNLAS